MQSRPAPPMHGMLQAHAAAVLSFLIQDDAEMECVTQLLTSRIAPTQLQNLNRQNGYVTFTTARTTFQLEDAEAIAPLMSVYLAPLMDCAQRGNLSPKETETAYLMLFAIAQATPPRDPLEFQELIEVLSAHYGPMHDARFEPAEAPPRYMQIAIRDRSRML